MNRPQQPFAYWMFSCTLTTPQLHARGRKGPCAYSRTPRLNVRSPKCINASHIKATTSNLSDYKIALSNWFQSIVLKRLPHVFRRRLTPPPGMAHIACSWLEITLVFIPRVEKSDYEDNKLITLSSFILKTRERLVQSCKNPTLNVSMLGSGTTHSMFQLLFTHTRTGTKIVNIIRLMALMHWPTWHD